MWSNPQKLAVAAVLLGACLLPAQEQPIPQGAVSVKLPPDSPLSFGSVTMADSRATARGGLLGLALRSVSDMCRSSTSNPPRAVARESAMVTEPKLSGESGGSLTLTAPCGMGCSCAGSKHAPRRTAATASFCGLLHIYFGHCHVPGGAVQVRSEE